MPVNVTPGNQPSNDLALAADHQLVRDETWPAPRWFLPASRPRRARRYEDFIAHQLRSRYTELEGDFRSVVGNFHGRGTVDMVTAERLAEHLHRARRALQEDEPDLLTAANSLDLSDRYMVWVYPSYIAEARLPGLLARVDTLPPAVRAPLRSRLERLARADNAFDPVGRGFYRPTFDEAIGALNRHVFQAQIGSGLQIRRLRCLGWCGWALLVALMAACPLAVSTGARLGADWAVLAGWSVPRPVAVWTAGLAVVLVGALGGFLSGLLQVRNSSVGLAEFQESMLKLELRVLVGGLVALVAYILLSWDILPGVRIESAGSYLFVAFAAGFSERYFLRLLAIPGEGSEGPGAETGPGPQPGSDPSETVGPAAPVPAEANARPTLAGGSPTPVTGNPSFVNANPPTL